MTAAEAIPFPFLTLIFPQEKYLLKCYNVWALTLLLRYLNSFDFLFIHYIQQSSFNLYLNVCLLLFGSVVIIVIIQCFPGINIIPYMLLYVDTMRRLSIHGWINIVIFFLFQAFFFFNDRSSGRLSDLPMFIVLVLLLHFTAVICTLNATFFPLWLQNDMFLRDQHGEPQGRRVQVCQLQVPQASPSPQ